MGIEHDPANTPTPEAEPTTRPKGNVQDEFLNELRTAQTLVKVLMNCGRELKGYVKAFDAFTIRLQCANADVLVYKSGVAALGPVGESTPASSPRP
ncbi:MAG: RNA chaperone Hfq [Armatimonadota bacterium]|jgi:host factor-I protein